MLRLEPRAEPSRVMAYASPLAALGLTVLMGAVLFLALGKDPVRGLEVFLVEPLGSLRALGELSIKATPLVLVALGLCVAFRANVWNIGAEGQFILGAAFAARVALLATPSSTPSLVVFALLAGVAG